MRYEIKVVAVALIILSIAIPVAFADEIGDVLNPPTVKVVYDGATPIKDAIDVKIAEAVSVKEDKVVLPTELTKEQIASVSVDTVSIKGLAAKTAMEKLKYPYELPSTGTTVVKIQKCRYDNSTQTMWYWIEATRDGKEVAVNNPVWIYPAPKDTVVSEVMDDKLNEVTVTLKEDPQSAVFAVLTQIINDQPLGKATVGTKE